MTRLLIVTLVCLIRSSSQQTCGEDALLSQSFTCEFTTNDINQKLTCESVGNELNPDIVTETVYHIHIYWTNVSITSPKGIFLQVIKTDFDSNSKINACIVKKGKFVVTTLRCNARKFCSQQMPESFKASFVIRTDIHNAQNDYVFNVLDEFSTLQQITIQNSPSLNISRFNFGRHEMLRNLYLKGDELDSLPNESFANLSNLALLDLSNNKIKLISPTLFDALVNLRWLFLKNNSIALISSNVFSKLTVLETVDLTQNQLSFIDENVFLNNKLLQTVDLSKNVLKTLPNNLLHGLENLIKFSCYICGLEEISENFFNNSPKLSTADFRQNEIRSVPRNFFEYQRDLKIIYMSRNNLTTIPDLRNKIFLKVLDLSLNNIGHMSKSLSVEAPNLIALLLNDNDIKIVNDSHVIGFHDLVQLYLERNKITSFRLGLTTPVSIEEIYCSHNVIEDFLIVWKNLPNLTKIHVNYNKLTSVELPPCNTDMYVRPLDIDARHNNISTIGMETILEDNQRSNRTTRYQCLPYPGKFVTYHWIDVSYNPLNCDCGMYAFYNYLSVENKYIFNGFRKYQLRALFWCFSPNHLHNVPLMNLSPDDFLCPVTANCPESCTCGIRGKDRRVYVNCSELAMNEVPKVVPDETSVLYFSRNNLSTIASLNNKIWRNLTELHLDQNDLTNIDDWIIPKNLTYLSLRRNKIVRLPDKLLNFMSNQSVFEFFFGENTNICRCESKGFKAYVNNHTTLVRDLEDIICEITSNGSAYFLRLGDVPDAILCAEPKILRHDPTAVIVSVCVVSVILIAGLLMYYKYRQIILAFLYVHCYELFQSCFQEIDFESDKTFDAFVAYSSTDRPIVMELLKELEEKDPHFQLCIHERDWLPGRLIQDNIISSVDASKRTIVVISNTFIASPWFSLELRASISKMSEDKQNKLIVILADKTTSLDIMDTDIRQVISKKTYLVWGERWFWKKLYYAMPRKSCLEIHEQQRRTEALVSQKVNSFILDEVSSSQLK